MRKTALVLFALAIGFSSACSSNSPKKTTVATQASSTAQTEKSEVELYDAKIMLEPPELLRFEVRYRFTKGAPTLNYMCELTFPGTENVGKKPLEAWELKLEGIIKGGIELQSSVPNAKDFEITLGEAEVPQSGYKKISNVLKGKVSFPNPTNE